MSDTRIADLENALAQAHLDHATEKRDLQHKLTESIKEATKLEEEVAMLTRENNRLKNERREMQELHTRELDNTKEVNDNLIEENDNLKREALVMKTQLEEQDRSLAEAFGRLELPENRDPPAKEPETRFNPRPSGGLDWDIERSFRQDRDLFSRAEARYLDLPRSSGPARSSGHARADFSRRGDSSRRI